MARPCEQLRALSLPRLYSLYETESRQDISALCPSYPAYSFTRVVGGVCMDGIYDKMKDWKKCVTLLALSLYFTIGEKVREQAEVMNYSGMRN